MAYLHVRSCLLAYLPNVSFAIALLLAFRFSALFLPKLPHSLRQGKIIPLVSKHSIFY